MSGADRREKIHELCESVLRAEGLTLYDLEVDTLGRRGGSVRVFIARVSPTGMHSGAEGDAATSGGRGGIGIADCVTATRRLQFALENDPELGGGEGESDYSLEVSSPGVNRRVRTKHHFLGAVGERLRVTFREQGDEARKRTLKGVLESFEGEVASVREDRTKECVAIPFQDVIEARVDFLFESE